MSIISAVTRKRKKCLSVHLQGSADEDSEHEPVKASNYRGGEGGGWEEKEDRGGEEAVKGEHTIPKKEERDERENGVRAREITEGKDSLMGEKETENDLGNRIGNGAKKFEREIRQRTTLAGNSPQLRSSCFLCSHHQIHATYQRSPTVTNPPHLSPHNLARRCSTVPFSICPAMFSNLHQASSFHRTQQPDWNQAAPVRYRKTRSGRTRAMSMNLDLELGKSEDRVRGCRAERVEMIRVIEGTPGPHRCAGVPQGSIVGIGPNQQIDPLPRLAQEASPLSSSSLGWTDQSSQGSSTVVLRRSALGQQDKSRAWRRHTVVV